MNTIVGERGVTLSGGERQRVAIARALLRDPPILVFDEATAALDALTEAKVRSAIEASQRAGRTVIVIAHRLSTIAGCDRVFVIDQGRLVQSGTPEDLGRKAGLFRLLVQAQSTWDVRADGV